MWFGFNLVSLTLYLVCSDWFGQLLRFDLLYAFLVVSLVFD